MSVNFYEEIISNYKKLYETKEDYDVKIYAGGEKPNIKEFHVHSFVLKSQSEFFKKAFTTKDGIEKKDGYLTKLQSREILNLLLSSDEFELQPLVTYIQETLIKNHNDFIIKNILEIVELTYQKKFVNKLWDFCVQEICFKSDCLFEST